MKATDGRPHAHWLRRFGALVCLAGLGLNAQAANTVTLSESLTGWSPNPGGGWVRNAYNPRTIDAANAVRNWSIFGSGAAGKIIATDVGVIAGRAGALPVSSAMSVGLGDAAAAVGRCMLGGGVICGAATAAAAAYAAYRVYAAPDGSGLMADPGMAPFSGNVTKYYGTINGNYNGAASLKNSMAEACEYVRQWYATGNPTRTYAIATCPAAPGPNYVLTCRVTANNADCGNVSSYTSQTTVAETNCPASIDPTNSAYNVPAGSPLGPDGKCPTARYNHGPITPDAAAAKVTANPPATPSAWLQPTKDAIDTGGQNAPAGITTTGPASQTGTPTSTTTTGGSPSQTITETKTPTYTYNYAGDTITYNTTITNVTNNITTGVTTTTTTSGNTAVPQDPNDPCTANPDRIGCLKLGATPTDVVPTKTPNITFSAESVGLPSACPADQVIAGKAYSFGPICDAATNARPWVIVGAIFSALMLMLAGVRQI